jgi:ABC-2 type transport system permease protein
MSAAAATVRTPLSARSADRRPSISRLVGVELRKMVDTRAGLWLQAATVVLTVVIVVLFGFLGKDDEHTIRQMLEVATAPASILLPIIGILLVSSEWSQRTSLITFALVPERGRVLLAKLVASLVPAVVALLVGLLVAFVGTALTDPGLDDTWSLSFAMFGQFAFSLATGMLMGVAFGAAFLSSAPAIVLSFVLPIGWAALGSLSVFEQPAKWLDQSHTLAPLTDHLFSASEWAHAGTTLLLWLGLPLLIGIWRIRRAEVR